MIKLINLEPNHKTLSADVIVDVGSSVNPGIDIGQIEGAFIQGMGWSTIEEVIYACDVHTWIRPRGAVFTTGPGTYKIPAFNDVPEEFNVSLLENVDTRVFIARDYEATRAHREKRKRDAAELDPFIDEVLKIEHAIISGHRARADVVITADYSVSPQS